MPARRVDDRLGAHSAARRVHVDGNGLVNAADDVVAVVEDAARAGADAAGDDDLGLDHLVVDLLDNGDVALVDRSGDEEDVGMLGVAGVDDAETLDVEAGAKRCQHFDIAAVAA